MNRPRILSFYCFVIAWNWASPVTAASPLDDTMRKLASDILKTTKQKAVVVGAFVQNAELIGRKVNVVPGLRQRLIHELERLQQGAVSSKAHFEVTSRIVLLLPDENGNQHLKIKMSIRNRVTDQVVNEVPLSASLEDVRALAEALQVTTVFTAGETRKEQKKKILQPPTKRTTGNIGGDHRSLISAEPNSSFQVEILRKKTNKGLLAPVSAQFVNGQVFVGLDKGDLYHVTIHNRSDREMAVSLTVDGIDIFRFSKDTHSKTGRPLFTHFIVPAKGKVTIPGWHISTTAKESFFQFLVTDSDKSMLAKLKRENLPLPNRSSVGVIQVALSHCWREGEKPPFRTVKAGSATGSGPPKHVKQKPVKRVIAKPHVFVSVRYTRP